MTQSEVFNAILRERMRQDELHPVVAKKMIPFDVDQSVLADALLGYRNSNDYAEKIGESSWYDVFMEEVYEIFSETDPVKIKEEAIQLAALCVRLCETL